MSVGECCIVCLPSTCIYILMKIEFDAFSVVYNLTRCQSSRYTGVLKVAAFNTCIQTLATPFQ